MDYFISGPLIFEKDLINIEHRLIGDVINKYSNSMNFISVLKSLSDKHSFGNSERMYTFWSDLDGYDRHNFYPEEFDGILLDYLDEERVVSYEIFYYYIQLACARFIEQHPEKEVDWKY